MKPLFLTAINMYSFGFHASSKPSTSRKRSNSRLEFVKKCLEIHDQVVSNGKSGYPLGEYPQFVPPFTYCICYIGHMWEHLRKQLLGNSHRGTQILPVIFA